jgi:hypothetical protein
MTKINDMARLIAEIVKRIQFKHLEQLILFYDYMRFFLFSNKSIQYSLQMFLTRMSTLHKSHGVE